MTLLLWLGILGVVIVVGAGIWLHRTDSGVAFAAIWVGIVCILAGGIGFGAMKATEIGCRNTARVAGLGYRWSPSTGCMVRFDGQWIPYDRWVYLTDGGR